MRPSRCGADRLSVDHPMLGAQLSHHTQHWSQLSEERSLSPKQHNISMEDGGKQAINYSTRVSQH